MRFCVGVIKPLIDVGSELFKPFIDVGGEVVKAFVDVGGELFKPLIDVRRVIVKAFVHGVEAFVDVGGEVVEAFVDSFKAFGHRFKTNIHRALQPIDLGLNMHEPGACFSYETSEFGVGNKLFIFR